MESSDALVQGEVHPCALQEKLVDRGLLRLVRRDNVYFTTFRLDLTL